jgi:hypothetical protein
MQFSFPTVLFLRRVFQHVVCAAGCCGLFATALQAAPADQLEELVKRAGMRVLEEGKSSAAAEKAAVAAFPMRSLSSENRVRAEQVLKRCTQYRKLPRVQYTIDEPLYKYLLQHPDVAVSTWRAMGISQFQMWQTGPQEYEASAADGSEGIADILYRDENEIIFICEGSYHNLLLPAPLEAAALIWFRTEFKPHTDGTHIVTQAADVFVHFPSAGVAGVAKILTPVTSSLMDRNLYEVSLYASMMSRAVRDEPEWIVDMSAGLDGVLPQRRTELADVARQPRHAQSPTQIKPADQPLQFVDRWVLESPDNPEALPAPQPTVAKPLAPRLPSVTSPAKREPTLDASPLIPRNPRRSASR